jgi:hypothetical protein
MDGDISTTIEEVKQYMNGRYSHWLDYAKYHCARAGIADEAYDVLNEVLCAYLSYPHDRLTELCNERKDGLRRLDWSILSAIGTSVWKATSGYQCRYHREKYIAKYHGLPITFESDEHLSGMEDSDESSARQKKEDDMYRRFDSFCKKLNIDRLSRRIFRFRFFEHRKWTDWEGKESRYILTKLYTRTREAVFREIGIDLDGKEK